MSTLSSTSTLPEVKAAYDDNASFLEDGSVAKARAFITACTILLRRLPKRVAKGGREGQEVELDPRVVAEQLAAATEFVTHASMGTARPVVYSIENFRD